MKIALIADAFPPQTGGMENHALGLAEALARRHEMIVFTTRVHAGHRYDLPFEVRPVLSGAVRRDLPEIAAAQADAAITLNAGHAPARPDAGRAGPVLLPRQRFPAAVDRLPLRRLHARRRRARGAAGADAGAGGRGPRAQAPRRDPRDRGGARRRARRRRQQPLHPRPASPRLSGSAGRDPRHPARSPGPLPGPARRPRNRAGGSSAHPHRGAALRRRALEAG